jgi:glutamyl-tRNA synthetase
MLNFFMILGWAPKDQREVLTLQEYINEFEPSEISAKSVVFDLQKLNWLNGVYIRNLSIDELTKRIEPFLSEDFPKDKLTAILPLVMERLVTLKDVTDLTEFFYRDITVDKQELVKKADAASVIDQLQQTVDAVSSIAEWNLSGIEQAVRSLQEAREWKKSQYFMMLRVAVTGRTATPPLFETIEVLGAEVVKKRLKQAISLIS